MFWETIASWSATHLLDGPSADLLYGSLEGEFWVPVPWLLLFTGVLEDVTMEMHQCCTVMLRITLLLLLLHAKSDDGLLIGSDVTLFSGGFPWLVMTLTNR